MSRWPVLVLVAAIALGAGVGLAQVRAQLADRTSGAASPGSAPAGSEDELVVRLITPSFSPLGQEQTVQLFRGALPQDPKVDAPRPPGARLIGSVVRSSAGAPVSVQLVLDAPGTSTDITSFYERELGTLGWKAPPERGPAPGGFQPTSPTVGKVFCKGDQPPWVTITVFPKEKGPNDVRLNYQLRSEGFGGGGPCSQQGFGPQPFPNRLPALRPPADVQFRFGGGMASGPDSQGSETNAVTSRSAADLEGNFAGQLSAAGWTRTGGSATGPVAWSSWKVPGDGDWAGLLLVIETGSDRRLLSVRAQSATAFR
jgi:hypothetical protein